MSHCIEQPVDEVYSVRGPEWHGLAKQPANGVIDDATVNRLCPDIVEMAIAGEVRGRRVALSQYKALVADYSQCRPETVGTEHELVPLHIPKARYGVISNCHLWEAVKKALAEIDAEVVTAGTLGAGKRCFFSVDISGSSTIMVNRADKFLAYLNIITSHDGSKAAMGYDSMTRVVCQNTLDASLYAAGNVGFKVYHVAGAEVCVERMGELINEILIGRATFQNQMELLSAIGLSVNDMHAIAAAYFVKQQSQGEDSLSYELGGKSRNAAESILNLARVGMGNDGKTAYDLLNGATEFWTHGDGTGKKASKMEKISSARFGRAAEHKQAFSNLLLAESSDFSELIAIGQKALSVSVK